MKVYILSLIILGLVIVPASAITLSLDFENYNDFHDNVQCKFETDPSACLWVHNDDNSYIGGIVADDAFFTTSFPFDSITYSAATMIDDGVEGGILSACFDENFTMIGNSGYNGIDYGFFPSYGRIELIVSGDTAAYYVNGAAQKSNTLNGKKVAYVGYSFVNVDDIIWSGDLDVTKYIFGMPLGYIIENIDNSSRNGLYNEDGEKISATTLENTFSRPTSTPETMSLISLTDNVTYQTASTGSSYSGTVSWNLTSLIASDAPYGLYYSTIVGSGAVSNVIPFVRDAEYNVSISFDKDNYILSETATLTSSITEGWYDNSTFSYHVSIINLYGEEIIDQPVSLSGTPKTGTTSHTWNLSDTYPQYYGLLYATYLSNGTDILIAYDSAYLNQLDGIAGYVHNAETTSVISGATVNYTRTGVTVSDVTSSDGFYLTASKYFTTGNTSTILAYATGYETYTHSFTPLTSGIILINLTLMPDNPTHNGLALGGIARTPPYNRTIDSATVTIVNSTTQYIATTNSVGYYLQDDMTPADVIWDVWGSKTGFFNSTTYHKLVTAS